MKKEFWFTLIYSIVRPVGMIFFPQKTIGRENFPEGPAVLCANHSSGADPFMLAFAMGWGKYVHFMAKHELSRLPVIGWIFAKAGVIFVKRGERDIDSIKSCIRALKSGEKIMLFPEGTRSRTDDSVVAKSGAVMLAARTGVPIVPVFIPRKKTILNPSPVVVGEPYYINAESRGDYDALAQDLMDRIHRLGGTKV